MKKNGEFIRYEVSGPVDYEKNVLALLQQCKDAGLTVDQAKFVLNAAIQQIDAAVSQVPIVSIDFIRLNKRK